MARSPTSIVAAGWLIAAGLLLPAIAAAAPVTVIVKGPDGRPLADAVVSVEVPGGPVAVPRGSYMVQQRDIAFEPHVLVVPVGASVGFPNRDKVRHHVYSFSKAKKFELKLYGQQEERTVTFDKTGVVALGCNIHDSMIGYIYVADTPFAAKTNAAGEAVLHGLPAGNGTLTVWHPDMKARTAVDKPLNLGLAAVPVTLELKPPGMRRKKG
jgi:plastocyanin